MEFLKALDLAQTKGVTKEEFIYIWQIEMSKRVQEEEQASNGAAYGDWQQTHHSDDIHVSGIRRSLHQFALNSQDRDDETKNGTHWNFQALCDQLLEKQEKQWLQMQEKYDQMVTEFRSRFEILSDHVSNTADSNSSSLKLFFMQELELLKQELKKQTDSRSINVPVEPSSQQAKLSDIVEMTIQEKNQDFGAPKTSQSFGGNYKQDELRGISEKPSQQAGLVSAHDEARVGPNGKPEPIYNELFLDPYQEQQLMNGQRTLSDSSVTDVSEVKSYANIVVAGKNSHVAGANESSMLCTSSMLGFSQQSFEAEGSFVQIIANQMTQKQAGSGSLKDIKKNKTGHSHQEFTISNSDTFSISKKPFLSEYMYSSGRPCRARVRVDIKTMGTLSVHIHVSKGKYDDLHKWPLVISSTGYIWNRASNRPTHIWQLEPASCSKPPSSEGEFIFEPLICLSTSRGKHPNISYKHLKEKHYTELNCLTFLWDLEAGEE